MFFAICQSSNKENYFCQRQFASQRKNIPEKLWVDKGTKYDGTFKKFCKEKNIEVYSTMSETKAEFAEKDIHSLKYII